MQLALPGSVMHAALDERAVSEAPMGSAATPFEGRVLGGTYRIVGRLGQGAMGVLFEAQHLRLYRRVAIKVLPAEFVGRPELRERFEQEAEIVSQIQHPHVVGVLDYDVTEFGEPYLVLELLRGETLAARLVRESPLSLDEAVTTTMQVAAGLAAAHRAAVVHRDLKPDNVFLVEDADEPVFAKLLDFGISKSLRSGRHLTAARMILGTPEYMAPEQASGRSDLVGPPADQHALAALTYEMLVGTQPFAHDDVAETLNRVMTLEPPAASSVAVWLPPGIDPVLARGLAKDPGDRFPNVMEFARALADAAGERPLLSIATGKQSSAATNPGSDGGPDARASAEIGRARRALAAAAVDQAVFHAEAACELMERMGAEGGRLTPTSESLLTRIFLLRLGSRSSVLTFVNSKEVASPISPRTAFLLSRLEEGMTVADVLDVAAMPQMEALRRLVQLESVGMAQLG